MQGSMLSGNLPLLSKEMTGSASSVKDVGVNGQGCAGLSRGALGMALTLPSKDLTLHCSASTASRNVSTRDKTAWHRRPFTLVVFDYFGVTAGMRKHCGQ